MHIFSRSGILARYLPQANSLYSKEFKEEGLWTTVYYNAYVTAYNTRRPRALYQKATKICLIPAGKTNS